MSSRSRHYSWYALGLLASANFFHYANRNVVVTMYDDLRWSFSLSNAELGLLNTAFMATHAVATLVFGWVADRVDRRRLMAAGVLLWSASAIAAVYARGIGDLLVSRAMVGIGTAACVPVANALICDVFGGSTKARSIAIFNLGLFFGGLAGIAFGGIFGFPFGFVVVAVPGFAIAWGIARLEIGGGIADDGAGWRSFLADARAVVAVPTMRWTIIGAAFMAFAAGGYLAWFFDFLVHVKHATDGVAMAILIVALAGGLCGVLAGGVVADRLKRARPHGRQLAIVIGFSVSVPCALAVIALPLGGPFLVSAWLLMFFISWYHGPLAASVDDIVPGKRTGTAQGIYISVMHLFGTAPASYIVGELADAFGLRTAMLAPTAAMLLAAGAFLAACPGVSADTVVKGRQV